jgi:glycosyltransferase involved in cell wall biosynthesis
MRASVAHLPVEWMGPVKAAEFYPQIDLLVVPPVWADPGPLVVHEAFANSVPVIGSRMGGVMDMVDHGVNGWLFEPKDAATLASLLGDRIEAGRAALPPPENFKAFQQRTLADSVAQQYEELYTDLIGKRGAA